MWSNDEIIPVVMFHSVGLDTFDWVFSYISEPVKQFEEKIALLCRKGYRFVFWRELYDHMAGRKKIPKKSIMLTFDDGYLDNWVYVFPILKKYGAKGTIFVNPDFVPRKDSLRPNLDDVENGKISKEDLQIAGFLNWHEMRAMESSGLIDIQSHALTHTWHFSAPRVITFHCPDEMRYPWMAWNERPERKPYYLVENQSTFIPFGTPIYKYEKSLICRRFFPPVQVAQEISAFVSRNHGEQFFLEKEWRGRLQTLPTSLMGRFGDGGPFEKDDGYLRRIFFGLKHAKKSLEKQLQKQIDFICWPGGGYNETVLKVARELGYKSWTLASRNQSNFRNQQGVDPEQVKRVGSFSRYPEFGGGVGGYTGSRYFLSGIERYKHSFIHTWLGRAMAAGNMVFRGSGRK